MKTERADGFLSGTDLFNNVRIFKPQGKVESERSTLVRQFVTWTGKEPKVIAIRLSRYSLEEMYYLVSAYKDRLNREGKETADKWFWAITRTEKI